MEGRLPMLFHNDKKQLFIINVLLNMLFKIKNKISYKVLALLWMMTARDRKSVV